MSDRVIYKAFLPDFSALYDVIGESETKHGYYIRKELYDDEYVYDLCKSLDDFRAYVYADTWCVLYEEYDDYVVIGTDSSSIYKEFKLSINEFHAACKEFVPYYIGEDGFAHDLEPEKVDW